MSTLGEEMEMIKQIIVMRTDLNMRKGKMIAQGSHSSMKVFFDRMKLNKESQYKPEERIYHCSHEYDCKSDDAYKCNTCDKFTINHNQCFVKFTPSMLQWMEGSFTKIVVGCNSEQELFDLQKRAEEAEVVNAIILDNGMTEFKENCFKCEGIGKVLRRVPYSSLTCTPFEVTCEVCSGAGKINRPTYTCLAIGPDESEKIDRITGHLKLI